MVEIADNGQVAVDKVAGATEPWDIVLMDMQMPVMDGVTATEVIRRTVPAAQLPIVAMTANAMQRDHDRSLAAGTQDFVTKPIEPDELWQALLRWVPPRAGAPAADDGGDGDAAGSAASRPVSEIAETALPTHVPGLDVDSGLRRVMGKRSLYVSMLRKFVAGQRGAVDEVRAALEAGDPATAERLAHTTKGVSGNIGAAEVQGCAGELEHAIKTGAPREQLDALSQRLQQALEPLAQALADWLPPEASTARGLPGEAVPIDEASLQQVTVQLRKLFEDMDSEAADLMERESALLSRAYPAHLEHMLQAVRDFDFDAALERLEAAAATHKV